MDLRRVVLLILVLTLGAVGRPVADASTQPGAGHETFDPHWRVISHDGATTNGRYTLVWSNRPGTIGRVLDENTGGQFRLRQPSTCRTRSQPTLGDSWLLLDCNRARVALYSLAGRRWRSVATAASCRNFDGGKPGACTPTAVGADWIEYDEASARLGDRFVFQNIATGALRRIPRNARTVADLDSPALARRTCSPLRVPPEGGTLDFDGRFALANESSGVFLEHCGTNLHRLLTSAPWASAAPGAIVWSPAPTRPLRGIFLPSLRPFAVAVPRGADTADVQLSLRHIYVIGMLRDGKTEVWSAAGPVLQSAPPR